MLPSLARLAPTGTQAAQEVLEKQDLFDKILHAIVANDPDLACKLATTWCDLNSEHRDACKDAWEDLAERVFPNAVRLRAFLAEVSSELRWLDARKVFVALCNTKHILRVIYAYYVYKHLDRRLSFMKRERHMPGHYLTFDYKYGKFKEFQQAANGWLRSADRARMRLQHGVILPRWKYFTILNNPYTPLMLTRMFVNTYMDDAINRAIDWSNGPNALNAERFVFEVSIEDKHQAMEALIDACVEAALDLLEQGLELAPGDRPPEVIDPLKAKMRAPFENI